MNEKQIREGIAPAEGLIEVWFPIEKDAHGYPETRSWEGMLSRRSPEGFVLESVPFYLKNVSRGDTVAAAEGDFLRFSQVIARGGHNTYRLLMADAPDSEIHRAIADLENLGLAVERRSIARIVARTEHGHRHEPIFVVLPRRIVKRECHKSLLDAGYDYDE